MPATPWDSLEENVIAKVNICQFKDAAAAAAAWIRGSKGIMYTV